MYVFILFSNLTQPEKVAVEELKDLLLLPFLISSTYIDAPT